MEWQGQTRAVPLLVDKPITVKFLMVLSVKTVPVRWSGKILQIQKQVGFYANLFFYGTNLFS